jgi:DNA-binding PadR family transcriptional regulator
MARRGRSNPLALVVLALLHERPMHPYEMSTTLRERRKEDSIRLNYGALYAVVESLQKRGLISPRETVREGRRPERTVYAITEAGAMEMMDWLSDLVANPVKEYPQFEAALSLLPVLPMDDAINLLESRLVLLLSEHRQQAGMLKQARQSGFPRLFVIEAEYQHALLAAEIDYVRTLVKELKEGTFPGVAVWRRLHELRGDGLALPEILPKIAEEFPEDAHWLDPRQEDPTI